MTRPCLAFEDDLAASATGACGFFRQFSVGASCGNGQHEDRRFGITCPCIEEGGALGAETGGVGGILLVAAGDLDAVVKFDGGSYPEV